MSWKKILCCTSTAPTSNTTSIVQSTNASIPTSGQRSEHFRRFLAMPFTENTRQESDIGEISADEADHASGSLGEVAVVATRARVTYELDRYEKNIMLLFGIANSKHGSRDERLMMERISTLKDGFGRARFEVETHLELTSSEIEEKCKEFFSRDFTTYGAAAVVVLAPEGDGGILSAKEGRFHESVVVNHLTSDLPESLNGKLKIYITEANRSGVTSQSGTHSLPILSYYRDVLGVHVPVIIHGNSNVLELISSRLQSGQQNLADLVYEAVREAEVACPEFTDRPIEVANTLTKEALLPEGITDL